MAAAAALMLCGPSAAPAQAAKSCPEPEESWQRATPAEAGMDAAKVQDALDYASTQGGFAVRIYRHGCLVGEDRLAVQNRTQKYESYSMGKSVTALLFGRAMTLREISPDDPVGSLVHEADREHGGITMLHLLTMSSGLHWNGFRDYNVFTMPDRIRDALTLPLVHHPGAYYEYAQSPVTLLAEAVRRAMAEDPRAFLQRELLDHLTIGSSDWHWTRDPAGHVYGFWGVGMRPDDWGRLGELLRRGGVWRGRRLLSERFMREAVAPSRVNGCYGWLIWINAAAPCIGATVGERPVDNSREFPELPADMYHFSGLFGQIVTVFPSQGLVVVRVGQDVNPAPGVTGGGNWQRELYHRVLGALTDQTVVPPGPAPRVNDERQDVDYGFHTAAANPDEYNKGQFQDPLPPAGPPRARAPQLELAWTRPKSNGRVGVRLFCPFRWYRMAARCVGQATLTGARKKARYSVAPGKSRLLSFKLTRKRLRALRRKRKMTFDATARNTDTAGGTFTRTDLDIRAPKKVRKRSKRKR